MEKELMPDYEAEEFYQHLIPKSIFEGFKELRKEYRPHAIFCKAVV